jgi:hypothetical protein
MPGQWAQQRPMQRVCYRPHQAAGLQWCGCTTQYAMADHSGRQRERQMGKKVMLKKILKWWIILSFGVLLIATLIRSCTSPNNTQVTTVKTQALTETAPVKPMPAPSIEPVKPSVLPNSKYDKMLSGAHPPEEQKIRQKWWEYDQQVCSDATLASDKKLLISKQTSRLDQLQRTYKRIFEQKDGDIMAVIRAKEYIRSDGIADADLVYMTPCLYKRGGIPKAASDLNIVQSAIVMTASKMIKTYDARYSSDTLADYSQHLKFYGLKALEAKLELASIR